MVYQNDKPSSEALHPNLLTSSFERRPRYANTREGEAYAMTCIKEQAIESTNVCLQTDFGCFTLHKEGQKRNLLPQKVVDTIINQLPKRVTCPRVTERSVLFCLHITFVVLTRRGRVGGIHGIPCLGCHRKYISLLQEALQPLIANF